MKPVFFLFVIWIFLFGTQDTFAQSNPIEMRFATQDSTSVPNGQVDVEVIVRDFENVLATQFTVIWDSLVLEIQDVPFVSTSLPGLNRSSFATPQETNLGTKGRLTHTWISSDAQAKSLPNGHILFTMRFKAVGTACSTTTFELLRTQTYQTEITDGNFSNIGAEINALPILVTGVGCNSFSDILNCNAFSTVELQPWDNVTELQAGDLLEGGPYDFSVIDLEPSSVDCSNQNQSISVKATHRFSGSSCFSEVLAVDNSGPILQLKDDLTLALNEFGTPNAFTGRLLISELDNGSYDNCTESAMLVFEPAFFDFDCSQVGAQELTVMASDENNNTSIANVTIQVEYQANLQLACPPDRVVNCGTAINDSSVIESVLGFASSSTGCIPMYEDIQDYDQNQDGDTDDEYMLNGQLIQEDYIAACEYGSIVRVWSVPGSGSACRQIIGLRNTGSNFDGSSMVDWPYSQDAIVSVAENDGLSCAANCPAGSNPEIEIIYDNNGNAIKSRVRIDCLEALCEEPFWMASDCSLIGWAKQLTDSSIVDGNKFYTMTYFVVDACQFDEDTGEGRWSWEVEAIIENAAADDLRFSIPDIQAQRSETVCMPLLVENFFEIQSIQGSINWDAEVLQYNSLESFGLPGLNEGVFGLNSTSEGRLSFVWFDATTVNPVSLPDSSALFEVCFDVIGDEGSSSLVEFTNTPTIIEVSSESSLIPYTVSQGSVVVGQGDCSIDELAPSAVCRMQTDIEFEDGMYTMRAIDFDAGSFDNCTSEEELRFNFENIIPENDPEFSGNTASRVYLEEDVFNNGNGMLILDVYVWDQALNKDVCQVNIRFMKEDPTNDPVEFIFGDYCEPQGDSLCVPLVVNNFTLVEAVQGTVTWDASIIGFTGVENVALNGFTQANINTESIDQGRLPFVWFDLTTLNPANFADSTVLMELCFELYGEPGQVSPLNLSDVPALIQVSSSGVGVRLDTVFSGSVMILDPDCTIDSTDFNWPSSELNFFLPELDENNYVALLDPDSLEANFDIDSSELKVYLEDTSCSVNVLIDYSDNIEELGAGEYQVERIWRVEDKLASRVYVYNQLLRNYLPEGFICDTLPNSAPIGDCESGHTLDDDVEWPDDIFVGDPRISPSELSSIHNIDAEDVMPQLFRSGYDVAFSDLIVGVQGDTLFVFRTWILTRSDLVGSSWDYTQTIHIVNDRFAELVTVNSFTGRPVPNVRVDNMNLTDSLGRAYSTLPLDPVRDDISYNGVDMRDAYLLRAHILAIDELDEIQQELSDFSGEGVISTLDLVFMLRIILDDADSTESTWQFKDITGLLQGPLQPRAVFLAYKMGDLDDNANLGEERQFVYVPNLIYQDAFVSADENYTLELGVQADSEMKAVELHCIIDTSRFELLDVQSDFVNDLNFNLNSDSLSITAIVQNDLEAGLLSAGDAVIQLELRAKEDGQFGEFLRFNDARPSFYLDENLDYRHFENIDVEETSKLIEEDIAEFFRVYPNPASDGIFLENTGQSNSEFEFTLYNSDGKRVLHTRSSESYIPLSGFAAGSYIYKIRTADRQQNGYLLIIK